MFLNHLYGGMDEPELKIIDVFICKLRKKLQAATGGKHYIETVWGRGYVLRDPADEHGCRLNAADRLYAAASREPSGSRLRFCALDCRVSAGESAMADKTPSKSAKVATKVAAKPVAAKPRKGSKSAKPREGASKIAKPKLLSGGNPQIAKGYGDAPVQAYIAAMPGWKRDVGRRLDALIVRTVPDVHKAVKWNSPLYGVEGRGWFLGFHCFTKYVKVAFFRGASLRPVPPGESKHQGRALPRHPRGRRARRAQFAAWVKQASQLPGERM